MVRLIPPACESFLAEFLSLGLHGVRFGRNRVYFENEGKITGFVFQNSWGNVGRDASGRMTKMKAKRGYYIVTTDYLKQNFHVHFNWDFALPEEIAKLPQFAKLVHEGH